MTIKNIIICGPSCSGKTTVARLLCQDLKEKHSVNLVLSNTTRPMRVGECQDIDYHFCDKKEFDSYTYLEQTEFRNWKYGVPIQNIKDNDYNILILNPEGVVAAIKKLNNYMIVYLWESFFVRFKRSIKRENKITFEMIRRGITDSFDFWRFKKYCKSNHIVYRKIKNENVEDTIRSLKYSLIYDRCFWCACDKCR